MRTNIHTNPFQEIIKLNRNALQGFSYLVPRELAQVNNPLELFEKQMELYVKNSYYMMDYIHQLSNIFNQSCDLYADKMTESVTLVYSGAK